MTLSFRIGLAYALAMPITLWALLAETSRSFTIYRTAEVADRQNASANALIMGVYNILIERQFINSALMAEKPASASDLQNIQDYRRPAIAKINSAFAELQRQEFPGKDKLVNEFIAARDKANVYRAKSDDAIKRSKADRDPDVVKNTYGVLSAYVEAAQKLWTTSGSKPAR
jgi:hypothetical protein